jgi:hypothetical protein
MLASSGRGRHSRHISIRRRRVWSKEQREEGSSEGSAAVPSNIDLFGRCCLEVVVLLSFGS